MVHTDITHAYITRYKDSFAPSVYTTPVYSCNGLFTELFIFRLKLPQIQFPKVALLISLRVFLARA